MSVFTFFQLQEEYGLNQLFYRDNAAFFLQIQKALLSSLYQAELISAQAYGQCQAYLQQASGALYD